MGRSYKLTLLATLYLAQGLPYGFFTQALPVLMREQGASLKSISATSLLFLPWALKFLWAPLADRSGSARQWLLPLQWGACLGAALLALTNLHGTLMPVFVALLLFNFAAAAQDVVTDGLAVRMLGEAERGYANGLQVGAYRLGMILGGGFLLWVFATAGWGPMFIGMSLLLLLASLPTLKLDERGLAPRAAQKAPGAALLTGWKLRLRRPGMWHFIGLISLYKFGDTMAASVIGPFLKDLQWSTEGIALLKGTVGSALSLGGAALGGWLALRRGRRSTLLEFGLLQSASLLLYLLAAAGWGGDAMVWAACVTEHLFGSIATVALFTLMMDASEPEHASTDYSLLACAVVIAQGAAMFSGAALADALGYATLFSTAAAISGLGCYLLIRGIDRQRGPQLLAEVWTTARTA